MVKHNSSIKLASINTGLPHHFKSSSVSKMSNSSESPVAVSNFWRERCANENNHRFISTVKGLMLGKIASIPLTDKFAIKMNIDKSNDPFKVADNLRRDYIFRKDRFPQKHFNEEKELYNVEPDYADKVNTHGGKRTYQKCNRMGWMDSSIDLSQPDLYFLNVNQDYKVNLNSKHHKFGSKRYSSENKISKDKTEIIKDNEDNKSQRSRLPSTRKSLQASAQRALLENEKFLRSLKIQKSSHILANNKDQSNDYQLNIKPVSLNKFNSLKEKQNSKIKIISESLRAKSKGGLKLYS